MPSKTPSGRCSDAWKNFERAVAELFQKFGFTKAFRVSRGDDIGVSDTDVKVPDCPGIQVDAKYRKGGWAHHTIFFECEEKYVGDDPDKFLILPTKGGGERGALVTLRLEKLLELLAKVYLGSVGTPGLKCPHCGSPVESKSNALGLALCSCPNCRKEFFIPETDVPKVIPFEKPKRRRSA